ncbi:hypothetical protein CPB85DRAFT_1560968 [Mucidula mucida]|nr:hypothetical protein CPB85DRAFT_1560968 [Mucidula mucida]
MSWFRTLFQLFNKSDKGPAIMQTNYDIPGVVSPTNTQHGARTVAWKDYLRRIRLDKHVGHERIVVRLFSENDERYIRLDRYKTDDDNEPAPGQPLHSPVLKLVITTPSNSRQSRPCPRPPSYELVQTFFPTEPLRVIDVAALASAITRIGHDYSLFCHMCLWWAALFFATARQMAGDPRLRKGPAFEERGTALGVRFVDDACRLFGSNGLDIESMVNITTNSMEKAGVDPDNIQKFIQALKDDYQKMSNDEQQNFRTNPVDRAYQATLSLSRIARTDIESLWRLQKSVEINCR